MTNTASDPDFDDKEQAEGARETVDEALGKQERQGPPNRAAGAPPGSSDGPLAEEQREQHKVPPRGDAEHAADHGDRG